MGSLEMIVKMMGEKLVEMGVEEGVKVEFLKLKGMLEKVEGYNVSGSVEEGGRKKKLGVEDLKELVSMRRMGMSFEKIGGKLGVSGMLVRNIWEGKLYKEEMEIVKWEEKKK